MENVNPSVPVNPQEAQQQPPPPGIPEGMIQMDQNQLEVVKVSLINTMAAHYMEFVNKCGQMPMHPHLKADGMRFLNAGFCLWKESVFALTVNDLFQVKPQPVNDPVSPEQGQAEACQNPA